MNILIIYAHFEPNSFTAALRRQAESTLSGLGHELRVVDLYAERFEPVPNPAQFSERSNPDYFELMHEQQHAFARNAMPLNIKSHHQMLDWASAVIFQFPFWWWSMPAILKGWVDQVLSNGFAYGDRNLSGKSAMLCVSAETRAKRFESSGKNSILYSIEHGILEFCGLKVLPHFVAPEVHSVGDDGRREYLRQFGLQLERNFGCESS